MSGGAKSLDRLLRSYSLLNLDLALKGWLTDDTNAVPGI